MTSLSNSQRSNQRKSPAAEVSNSSPSTTIPANVPSSQTMSGSRSSSGSTKSSAYKRPSVRTQPSPRLSPLPNLLQPQLINHTNPPGQSAIVPNREERHSPSCSHQTVTRNPYTMVTPHRDRGRGLRRLRPPGLRIQHRLQSLQFHRHRNHRLGPCARIASCHLGGDAQSRSQPRKSGSIPAPHQGHHHLFTPWPEAQTIQAEIEAEQGELIKHKCQSKHSNFFEPQQRPESNA